MNRSLNDAEDLGSWIKKLHHRRYQGTTGIGDTVRKIEGSQPLAGHYSRTN